MSVDKKVVAFGGGGKGGGGGGRRPIESPDNLHSTAKARVLDIISEGPVFGPVGGEQNFLKNYYLNGTPVQNEDGSFNFPEISAEYKLGTQDQDYVKGFPAAESGVAVGADLKHGQPWSQTLTNSELSAIVINLGVRSLVKTDDETMDRGGAVVNYRILLQVESGPFEEVLVASFNGKTTSGYERSHRINLPTATRWTVRVIRDTPESTTDLLQNATYIGSYIEVIDAKLRYPMTALIGVSVDAEQFSGGIPTRSALWRGRIVKVPSNYDTETRSYSGTWDGTFKSAWTDNPAWIYYDLVLNDRYGLGRRIEAYQLDRYALYRIARYCDEMVPDGFGGAEPRFTCNVYIQKAADAHRVIQDLASAFRGMSYWAGGMIRTNADIPSDPVYSYTNANVVDGQFTRTSSGLRQRFTVAAVSYNDMSDFGRQKVEFVQDDAAVTRYGIREQQLTAFGCTSRGQAHRVGKYQLVTSQVETGGISFRVGLDNIRVQPGDIIKVLDQHRAGRRMGGRIISYSTEQGLQVDSAADLAVGDTISTVTRASTISAINGNYVKTNTPLGPDVVVGGVWSAESNDLKPELYRVMSVREQSGTRLEFEVNAIAHEPQKFSSIDYGTKLEPYPTTVVPPRVQDAPTNVTIGTFFVIREGVSKHTLAIRWDKPANAVRYDVQFRRDNGEWASLPPTGSTSIEIDDVYSGLYVARVRAVNALDVPSLWAYSDATQVDGLVGEPPRLTALTTKSIPWGVRLQWGFPDVPSVISHTQIYFGTSSDFGDANHLGDYAYPTNSYDHTNLNVHTTFYYWARLIDKNGVAGPWYPSENEPGVQGMPSQEANEYLDLITQDILESSLGQEMWADIESIPLLDLRLDDIDGRLIIVDGKVVGIENSISDLPDIRNNLQNARSKIDVIETQVSELLGTEGFDPQATYLEGQLVKFDGALYRAKQDVPTGTEPTNTTYWEKVGDYESIGEAVATLIAQYNTVRTDVDELTGEVSATSQTVTGLVTEVSDIDLRVTGNSSAIESLETDITQIGDELIVTASRTTSLRAHLRDIDDGTGALAEVLNTHDSQAWIDRVETVVVENEAAQAAINTQLGAQIGDSLSLIDSLEQVVATNESTQATTNQTLLSKIGDNTSLIQNTQQTIVDLESSQATINQQLESKFDNNVSLISDLSQTVADNKSAQATTNQTLQNAINSNATGIQNTQQAITDLESSQATVNQRIESKADGNSSLIDTLSQTVADNKSTQAGINQQVQSSLNSIDGSVSGHAVAISGLQTSVQNLDGRITSEATRITNLSSTVGTNTASISDVSSAVTSVNGKLSASRAIKVGINSGGKQYIAGMGLDVTSNGGVTQSQMLVVADRFAVMPSTTSTNPKTVFAVQGGTVYMSSAMIQDASITNAKIANSTITSAKIADATITSAKIADASITNAKISGDITSAGYVWNTSGWSINKNGSASFPGLTVSGGTTTINRLVLTNPNVIASGTRSITSPFIGFRENYTTVWTTYIDTGINVPGTWNQSASAMYSVSAKISGGTSDYGGVMGYGKAELVVGDGLRGAGGPTTPTSNRIYIAYTFLAVSATNRISAYFRATRIDWKVTTV